MTSTTPATKKPAPKKPTDRQPSKAEILAAEAKPPLGHDTLRPAVDLRSGEQADATAAIMELFLELGIDLSEEDREEVEIENTPHTLRVFGRMAATLEPYAADLDAFVALDKGAGAGERISALAMWFLAELGKLNGSAS